MKKVTRQPDVEAGILAVVFGAICLVLVVFATASLGKKSIGATSGFFLLVWGIGQLQAARKNKQQESGAAKKKDS